MKNKSTDSRGVAGEGVDDHQLLGVFLAHEADLGEVLG